MGPLHANYDRNLHSFTAKYRVSPEALVHLDYYARSLQFEAYFQAKGKASDDSSFHPVCHGVREIAERRLTNGIVAGLFDVSVELFAGKRIKSAKWGTYPQVVPADAARLASASYLPEARCLCAFPDVCGKCVPKAGSEVLIVDVYALEAAVVEKYLREYKVTLLSMQWVHPDDDDGDLGGSEMKYQRVTRDVYRYSVPAGAGGSTFRGWGAIGAPAGGATDYDGIYWGASLDAPVDPVCLDEYHHPRWLSRLGTDLLVEDVFELTDPIEPDRSVYSLFRIRPVVLVPPVPGPSAIDRHAMSVMAYTSEQQRGTLLRLLEKDQLVTLDNAHMVVEGIMRDLAAKAVAARMAHTPTDSVNVAMSARLQKDASMSARLPVVTALWLRFVSLPLRHRLILSLVLFVVANLLVALSWTSVM